MPNGLSPLFPERLVAWYHREGRALPWREDPSPYHVVVSEFMLQQTTVETVLPYYERFLGAFPDFASLAAAREVDVLSLWEGLGYYSRARKLHALAQAVVARGGLPDEEAELLLLPGVGPYTAGAIRAFAFRQPGAAVDGNVRRSVGRVLGLRGEKGDEVKVRHALLPVIPEDPFDFTQALMDLGALVCRPRTPLCGKCPVQEICLASLSGEPAAYAVPPKKVRATDEEVPLVAVLREGEVLLIRREGGLLSGLWGLPRLERGPDGSLQGPGGFHLEALRDTGIRFRHVFTHRRWHVAVHLAEGSGEGIWALPDAPGLPLGGPDRKALRALIEGGHIVGHP